jgi:RNA polymerase sigma-70 factor (ECF subfamily)
VKKRMRALRDRMPVDDQTLLVLRIDKGLSWNELAAIFSGEGEALEHEELVRWAARLRQRFTTVKQRLRALAVQEGIIEDSAG